MALFKTKEQKAEEERIRQQNRNMMYQKLSQVEILDDIIETLKNGPEWRYKCQSYYDKRTRRVCIDTDLFSIEWLDGKEVKNINRGDYTDTIYVDNFVEKDAYRYTNSGYAPLPNSECIRIWTDVVRERMMALWPMCSFGSVSFGTKDMGTKCEYYFEYTVPAIQWKKWY